MDKERDFKICSRKSKRMHLHQVSSYVYFQEFFSCSFPFVNNWIRFCKQMLIPKKYVIFSTSIGLNVLKIIIVAFFIKKRKCRWCARWVMSQQFTVRMMTSFLKNIWQKDNKCLFFSNWIIIIALSKNLNSPTPWQLIKNIVSAKKTADKLFLKMFLKVSRFAKEKSKTKMSHNSLRPNRSKTWLFSKISWNFIIENSRAAQPSSYSDI